MEAFGYYLIELTFDNSFQILDRKLYNIFKTIDPYYVQRTSPPPHYFWRRVKDCKFLFCKINKLKSKQSNAWGKVTWNPNFIVYNTNLRLGGIKFKVHVSLDGLWRNEKVKTLNGDIFNWNPGHGTVSKDENSELLRSEGLHSLISMCIYVCFATIYR